MKRGNYFPQVRARWALGPYAGGHFPPPCYVTADVLYTIVPDPLDPGDIDVVTVTFKPKQWNYQQDPIQVFWKAEWVDLTLGYFGTITWRQVIAQPDGCLARVEHEIKNIAGTFDESWTVDDTVITDGLWLPFGGGFGFRFGNTGLIPDLHGFYVISPLHAATYADLRAAGYDDHDTRPATWNG